MKKKNIKKWVKALRSGKYKQTKDKLQDKHGYCCLGVACELFIPKNKQERTFQGLLIGNVLEQQFHCPSWLKNIPYDFDTATAEGLAILNDQKNFSFDEIADMLEAVYIHEVLK